MHNLGSQGRKYAQPWIPWPAVCTTLDSRTGMMHNPGSMGTWLESHRVIDSETVCSCDPLRAGWSSLK
jgi:hypothetical protein